MGSRHHMVMAARKGGVNSRGLGNREIEGSLQVIPSLPVGNDRVIAEVPLRRSPRVVEKLHRHRTSRQVVGTQIPGELDVEVADGHRRGTRNSEDGVYLRY